MASVASYGGFTHTDNEVNLVTVDHARRYSPRNKRLTETRTLHIQGELIDNTTSATQNIVTRAQAVIDAYSQDYKDFTFTVGGVLAQHLRNSSDCLSGVKVIRRSFPSGGPEQFAVTRTFGVVLQATYDVAEEDLVSWEESIEVVGTGGPLWVAVNTVAGIQTLGGPLAYVLAPATVQYYYQTGRAVGFNSYPVPPPPINSAFEFAYKRRIRNTSGTNQGTSIKFYRTSWSYEMATDPRLGTYTNTPTSK